MILLGFLTDIPSSDKTLVPENGMHYLEDNKHAIICQVITVVAINKHNSTLFIISQPFFTPFLVVK